MHQPGAEFYPQFRLGLICNRGGGGWGAGGGGLWIAQALEARLFNCKSSHDTATKVRQNDVLIIS